MNFFRATTQTTRPAARFATPREFLMTWLVWLGIVSAGYLILARLGGLRL